MPAPESLGAAALDLRKERRTDSAAATPDGDDQQRYEPLVEESVVQYGKAANLFIVERYDTFAAVKSRLNQPCPIRVRSHQRIHEADTCKIARARGSKGDA